MWSSLFLAGGLHEGAIGINRVTVPLELLALFTDPRGSPSMIPLGLSSAAAPSWLAESVDDAAILDVDPWCFGALGDALIVRHRGDHRADQLRRSDAEAEQPGACGERISRASRLASRHLLEDVSRGRRAWLTAFRDWSFTARPDIFMSSAGRLMPFLGAATLSPCRRGILSMPWMVGGGCAPHTP